MAMDSKTHAVVRHEAKKKQHTVHACDSSGLVTRPDHSELFHATLVTSFLFGEHDFSRLVWS